MSASFQPLTGIIRFGPEHRDWRSKDPWAGCVNWMADLYDHGLCHLFSVAGEVRVSDRRDVLNLCADMGFERMRETRNGSIRETDLKTHKRVKT